MGDRHWDFYRDAMKILTQSYGVVSDVEYKVRSRKALQILLDGLEGIDPVEDYVEPNYSNAHFTASSLALRLGYSRLSEKLAASALVKDDLPPGAGIMLRDNLIQAFRRLHTPAYVDDNQYSVDVSSHQRGNGNSGLMWGLFRDAAMCCSDYAERMPDGRKGDAERFYLASGLLLMASLDHIPADKTVTFSQVSYDAAVLLARAGSDELAVQISEKALIDGRLIPDFRAKIENLLAEISES